MVSPRARSVRPSASSARAAHAPLNVGWWAATSAAELPAASSRSASAFGGSRTGSGPPSRSLPAMGLCGCTTSAALRLAGRQQVLAGLDHAGRHAGLGGLEVAARVVGLLVADLPVDLQDAVVVAEHVARD